MPVVLGTAVPCKDSSHGFDPLDWLRWDVG